MEYKEPRDAQVVGTESRVMRGLRPILSSLGLVRARGVVPGLSGWRVSRR